MQRKSSPPVIPIVLLLSISLLVCSFVLFLPSPQGLLLRKTSSSMILPDEITLISDGFFYSTSSASLITKNSYEEYVQRSSIAQEAFVFLTKKKVERKSPLDEGKVTQWIESIATVVEVPAVPPKVVFENDGKHFHIESGKQGKKIEIKETQERILALDIRSTPSASLVFSLTGKTLNPDEIAEAERLINGFVGKTITLQSEHFKRSLGVKEISSLLDLPHGFSTAAFDELISEINPEVTSSPTEPVLEIQGNEVIKFVAPRPGKSIDRTIFEAKLKESILSLGQSPTTPPVTIPLLSQQPSKSLSATNSLGISERIGLGESEYAHSIPNRVHNVGLTTSKIHAKLIMPGEEFSFNKYLGEVSAATGFKPAYVIKEGQTVLGDGGGVCQVSSTLFRAILNAGFPVTERRGHSYRVSYYEENSKPGFDATVYSPHPDLRFVNDSPSALLINAVADSKNLSMYIELWGTSDGRKAEILNYKQWDATPPPPAIYQDDSTLPPGKLKQVDFAAPGLKTSFEYVVTYPDGQKKSKVFQTNYTPWAAVYLRGV